MGGPILMRRYLLVGVLLIALYGVTLFDEAVALEWMRKGAALDVPPPTLSIKWREGRKE